jgi:dipeptidyl aminopeptidase/acylaminoacyl peptidase
MLGPSIPGETRMAKLMMLTPISTPIVRLVLAVRKNWFLIPLMLMCVVNSYGQVGQLKPFTVEDMLRKEELGETAFSPDGQLLAYVVKRAKVDGSVDALLELNNNEHADVWIASVAGGPTINITKGLADKAGYWAPRWSPDGQQLAMLGVKRGTIQLYIWNKDSKRLQLLSSRIVVPATLETNRDPFVWISERQIVFVSQSPEQQRSRLDATISEWTKAREGITKTASVLESGVPVSLETRSQKEMVLIDVSSRDERTLTTGTNFSELILSPNRQFLSFFKQVGVWHPDSSVEKVTVLDPAIYQVMVTDFKASPRTLSGVNEALQGSLIWSPNSENVALVGYGRQSGLRQTIFNCHAVNGTCVSLSENFQDLDPNRFNRFVRTPLSWLPTGELLVFSRNKASATEGGANTKGWWAISETGLHKQLFADKKTQPTQILAEVRSPDLIAVIAGELWRIGTDGRLIKKIVSDFTPKINSIVWGDRQSANTNIRTRREPATEPVEKLLVVEARQDSVSNFYLIDTQTAEVKALTKPALNANVVAVDTRSETIALFGDDERGTSIWAGEAGAKTFRPIVEINTFLRGVFHPRQERFQYYSADGELLNGWVILPNNYIEKQRYPTILWVYPSTVYTDRRPRTPFFQRNIFDLNLLAARGYAVLLPSIPLKPYGDVQDQYLELSKGVIPAIDKLVELGIADPERIGLLGHSYGGFAAYGLLTQTKRFKATVASAGIANFASVYGMFDPARRYEPDVHENLFQIWNVETIGMGGPPWRDLGRYLRNSPINYVERVETPLLIIQGDFDALQLQQGEEFFTALYRQNKRARFVRYFGEGHVVESPANVRDMWNQIFSWFDEYLAPKMTNSVSR